MKIKSWPKLIVSLLLAQSAGLIGSLFTFSAIANWYSFLNKPSFSPPNWLFGPVWTLLYFLIGISFYRIWTLNNKKSKWLVKFFLLHLVLNTLWSIIFFGLKNPGLAFFEIVVLWSTIVYMIIKLIKIDKLSTYLLVPYLLWVSFATLLNFSIWKLNPDLNKSDVFAQDEPLLSYQKAFQDYTYTRDVYNQKLADFNKKKNAYLKNRTLSLKEEARLSLYDFLVARNDYIISYITSLRSRTVESQGLTGEQKTSNIDKIDTQVRWYQEHKNVFGKENSLEELLSKSAEEDTQWQQATSPSMYFVLSYLTLGDTIDLRSQNVNIYNNLKNEADTLISLGRADSSLFERWFKDIEGEITNNKSIEEKTIKAINKMTAAQVSSQKRSFNETLSVLKPAKTSLLKLNNFIYELENVIQSKR